MKDTKKMSVIALILMIFTTVFGFNNITRSFWLMGYAAIPWYILSGVLFFLPYAFINAEFGAAFKESKGGIYTWMEKSVGPKYAFIGTFMWYVSYVIWLLVLAITIWVSFSYIFFGKNTTGSWTIFGIKDNGMLALLGIFWITLLTWAGTKGVSWVKKVASVGGSATALLNIVLIVGALIVFFANGGKLMQPFAEGALTKSPNPNYQNVIAMIGFVVMALFAYGGVESVAGYVDDTENAEVNFPKGLKIAAIVITVGYSFGILCVGMFTNWNASLSDPQAVNFANASYEIMKGLGVQIGKVFNMSNPEIIGQFIVRYMAASLFLALSGAYLALLFGPLKQLLEGTPKEMWPGKLSEIEDGIPKKALWAQWALIVVLIIIVALAGGKGGKFFENLTMMMNTAMTVPYIFVALAFIGFKNKDEIKKPFIMFKTKGAAKVAAIVSALTVAIGNILQIVDPINQYNAAKAANTFTDAAAIKDGFANGAAMQAAAQKTAYVGAGFMVAAPIVFSILAILIYSYGKKKLDAKMKDVKVTNVKTK